MNDKVVKKSDIDIIENEIRIRAQNFLHLLHKEPDKNNLRPSPHNKKSKYLPISFLEMQLDEMFFGIWETKNFTYQTIANELVGSIELRYWHPTMKKWITRTGAGAVQIQLKSVEKGGSGDITNIKDKYINTLTKDFPHLKAECFRNACLSIGKSFGRDLNRDFEDQYNPLIKVTDESKPLQIATENLIIELDAYVGKDKEEIRKLCQEKQKTGTMTLQFINETMKRIGVPA